MEKRKGKRVDWAYLRKNCESCEKARSFLELHKIEITESADARKERMSQADVLRLARSVERVAATRGRSVSLLEMKNKPADAELLKLMMGPTGNLRAPTLRVGRQLVIGFNETEYQRLFEK